MRRKINLGLSIVIGGLSVVYLYDQGAKDFVIIAVMLGNNFLYSGLSKLVQVKAKQHNGLWLIAHEFLRPHTKIVVENGMVKEKDCDTDKTVMIFPKDQDNE